MSGESLPMELCRTCCKPQDPAVKHTMLVPVAATGQHSGLTISEMIYQLTEILVTLEPLLPQHICADCVVSLEAAHGFRQMTINSNTLLLDRRDQQKQLEESEANPDEDGEMLVIKEETFDVDLDTEDSNLYSLLEQEVYGETVPEKKKKPSVRKSTRKRKRCQTLAEIVMKECVERRGDRYFCIADPTSNCQRSTTLYGWDVGNTIRHCRAMHKAVALAHGLFKEPDQPQSSVAKSKSKPKPDRQAPKQKLGASEQKKRTFRRIARECMHKKEGRFVCAITGDSTDCTYNQRALDMGNFIRHFRVRHTDLALAKGLLKPEEKLLMEMKQARIKIATQATKQIVREIRQEKVIEPTFELPTVPAKVEAKIDTQICDKFMFGNIMKLIVMHGLPVDCFEWDGFRSILKALVTPQDVEAYSRELTSAIGLMAEQILSNVRLEMQHKLVSILIDFGARHGRCNLTLSAQFELNSDMQTRVLGFIRWNPDESDQRLCERIWEVLKRFDLDESRIYAIIVEGGTNMFCLRDKLFKAFSQTVNLDAGKDFDGSNLAETDEMLERLTTLLQKQFVVLRGPLRELHLAMNSLLPETDSSLMRINKFVRALRDPHFNRLMTAKGASCPTINTAHRWPAKYQMIESLSKQKDVLTQLVQYHPELDFTESDWQYVDDFLEAFAPLYALAERTMLPRTQYHPFSEFYMQWLMIIRELRRSPRFSSNRFLKPLTDACTRQVAELRRQHAAYQAGMLLDPRFNYIESVVFSGEQRDELKRNKTVFRCARFDV